MKKLKVHAAANFFPMMSDQELQELAEDIKTNGQKMPIIVDQAQLLIDGRNRLRACEIAGVEPILEVLDGDPLAYIHSANIKRRHLSKGQAAMLTAMLFPEVSAAHRGKKSETTKLTESVTFSRQRLGEARQILAHSPAMAEDIIHGITRFDDAVDQVRRQQKANETAEQAKDRQRKEYAKALVELRKAYPDLADKVDGEDLTLPEALAVKKTRDEEIAQDIAAGHSAAARIVQSFDVALSDISRAIERGARPRISEADREVFAERLPVFQKLMKENGV